MDGNFPSSSTFASSLQSNQSLESVLPAALAAVGYSVKAGESARQVLQIPPASQVCVVLVDGLGYQQLQARRGHIPNLRALDIDTHINTVFPSTTAAAITAFGTGLLPGESAMAGYALRSPYNGRVFSLINWNDAGISAEKWQNNPTLFEMLKEEAIHTAIIQPQKFIASGLSMAALRGAPVVPAESLEERVQAAANALRKGKKLVYLYWGELDAVGHRYGWKSERWINELEYFDMGWGSLLRQVPPGTLVILTADHGMVDAERKIDIAAMSALRKDVECVAGEERAFQIYTSDPQAVAKRWEGEVADIAWIYTKEQLIASGWLGKVSARAQQAIGDVWAIAKDTTGFVDSRVHSSAAISMVGVHGSRTEAEMQIPLIMELC
ncbi:MAG: alkaline phosphatase family protein [Actinomycetaceae bacterium]|nr:alkaline phosphatase family protein [Actinomycetaceae bacterium]